MGAQAGVLQGERRWEPLALVYLSAGLGRIIIGTALVLVRPGEFSAMLGVALGCWIPVLVGVVRAAPARGSSARHAGGAPGPRPDARGRHQQPGAARVLRPVQRRHPDRTGSDVGLGGRALRQRPDHGEGDPVLPAVRRGDRVPVDVRAGRVPQDAGPGADGLARRSGSLGVLGTLLLPDLALLFVGGDEFAGDQGRPVDVRDRRHAAGDAPAARLLRAGATAGPRGRHHLDRARRARRRRGDADHRDRAGHWSGRVRRRRAVPRAVRARGEPAVGRAAHEAAAGQASEQPRAS